MTEPTFDPPLACAHRNHCLGQFGLNRAARQEIVMLNQKLTDADGMVDQMSSVRFASTEGAMLSRERQTVKSLQATDLTPREEMDRLAEENFILRRLLNTNGFKYEQVEEILQRDMRERKPAAPPLSVYSTTFGAGEI